MTIMEKDYKLINKGFAHIIRESLDRKTRCVVMSDTLILETDERDRFLPTCKWSDVRVIDLSKDPFVKIVELRDLDRFGVSLKVEYKNLASMLEDMDVEFIKTENKIDSEEPSILLEELKAFAEKWAFFVENDNRAEDVAIAPYLERAIAYLKAQ